MRIIFLFLLISFLTSCGQSVSPDKNVSSAPSDFELTEKAENDKQNLKGSIKAKELEDNKILNQERRQALKKYIAELSKDCRLSILENQYLSEGDLEIHIWRHSGWFEIDVFAFNRISGKWTAGLQKCEYQDPVSLKLKMTSKENLGEPKEGWAHLWKRLIREEILTLQDGYENGGSDPCPDCGFFIIETNHHNEYRFYLYTLPSLKSEIRESRQVAKIGNIIAEEFNLQNFKLEPETLSQALEPLSLE